MSITPPTTGSPALELRNVAKGADNPVILGDPFVFDKDNIGDFDFYGGIARLQHPDSIPGCGSPSIEQLEKTRESRWCIVSRG